MSVTDIAMFHCANPRCETAPNKRALLTEVRLCEKKTHLYCSQLCQARHKNVHDIVCELNSRTITKECANCKTTEKVRACACRLAYFCGTDCQKALWSEHKKECTHERNQYKELEKLKLSASEEARLAHLTQAQISFYEKVNSQRLEFLESDKGKSFAEKEFENLRYLEKEYGIHVLTMVAFNVITLLQNSGGLGLAKSQAILKYSLS